MLVGKLMSDGELRTKGINTRLPPVTDGLVVHYPMDYTIKGIANLNLIDYSTWKLGVVTNPPGSYRDSINPGGFWINGDGNEIIEGQDPFGSVVPVWRTLGNDTALDEDGGWYGGNVEIDPSKLYRFSVWVKRTVLGNGTFYLGTNGIGSAGGQDGITRMDSSTWQPNFNPYFYVKSFNTAEGFELDEWYLIVGHVFPHDTPPNRDVHRDTGMYSVAKGKITQKDFIDFRWHETTVKAKHRSYLYYSTDPTTNQQWVYPRIDLCDGTEPSIEDLLNGEGNVINPSTTIDCLLTKTGLGVSEKTTNLITNPTSEFIPWGGKTGRVGGYVTDNGGTGYYVHTISDEGGVRWFDMGTGVRVKPSTTYTISLKVKSIDYEPDNNIIYIREINVESVQINEKGFYVAASKVPLEDGWIKASYTFITTSTTTLINIQSYEYLKDRRIFVEDIQLEERPIATPYVLGSKEQTKVEFPLPRLEEYTVVLKTYLASPAIDGEGYSKTANNATMIMIRDNEKDGYIEYRYYQDSNGSVPFLNSSGPLNTTGNAIEHIHRNNQFYIEKPLYLIMQKIGDSFTLKLYQDGWKTPTYKSTPADSGIDLIAFSEDVMWNQTIRGLSIYNRVLSDDELLKYIKTTHTMTETGVITSSIQSRRQSINGYRFPFDLDQNEINDDILATSTDVVYGMNPGGAYIGDGIVNLVRSTEPVYVYSSQLTLLEHKPGYIKIKAISDNNYLIIGNDNIGKIGKTYTITGIIKKNGVLDSSIFSGYRATTYQGPASRWIFNSDGSFIITQEYPNDSAWFIHAAIYGVINGDIIEILDFQVVEGGETKAFSDTNIGKSELTIPYDVIDCKTDFTIYGWWYPTVVNMTQRFPCLTRNTATNADKHRILIMNDDNNLLRCWYGSGGNNETNMAVPDISIEVDHWNFFCFTRKADTVTLYLGNSNGVSSVTASNASILDVDEVNQLWRVGRYINDTSHAFHKDYTFVQRALTDTEITDLHRKKMNASYDGLKLSGDVKSIL